ncbi:MAG: diguanylate cyclase [Actinobacteria bacterium]|nr:diguanylate cyclase [Actinomycetota bacterium]
MPYDDRRVVLLVANDYNILGLLEQTFVQADLRISEVADIEQAVAAMQQEMPDIVVCDTDVKNVNRQSLQQRMPDNLELQSLPFIFLYSDGPIRDTHRHLDLDQYLHKPFTPIALAVLVERMLAQRQSLAHLGETDNRSAVANRKALRKEVFRELQRIERYGGNMSICILDIVDKSNEDAHVPVVAPVAFNAAAETLPEMIRVTDFLARLSRKRFLWVMPETNAQEAELALQRLMAAFAELPTGNIRAELTIRAGLATAPDHGASYEELVKVAEQRLTTIRTTPKAIS